MVNELRARVQTILPGIRANAARAEMERRVPDENVALLKSVGLFRSLQPKAFGGTEIDFPDYAECLVDIAEACASTAWACGLLANHAHGVGLYSLEAQREIWGADNDALISSSVAPLGKAEPVPGGIRLSGRFGWSSGCDHAGWAELGYMGKNHMGQPGPCFALVPKHEYTILDDWNTSALRGTGSKTLVVDSVFVPDYRCESMFALDYGLSKGFGRHEGKIFRVPFSPVICLAFSATAIGAARRFLQLFVEKAKARTRAYNGAKSSEDGITHARLAESAHQTAAAHELLRKMWREMSACSLEQKLPAAEEMINWRSHQAYAIKMAIEAVQRLMMIAGGTAWFNDNEMQRVFRDVHITGVHAQTDYGMAAQTHGRFLLGLPRDGRFY
jgi:4-hydroxyphenylacetate 3-monooxygenase